MAQQITPQAALPSFAEMPVPPAPDYANPASWSAGSAGPGPSAAVPEGASPAARNPQVDVYYIHPSTYRSRDRWNVAFDDPATSAWTDASVVARQASVFNGCCRVFSPRYRQASMLNTNGGRLLADLLERAIDGTPLQKQLVAAYVVGINVAEGDFPRRFKHIPV